MSKLFERAKVRLENAHNSYRKIQQNDAYLDDCCYNLQQAVEMMLKYCVELTGQSYVENHDIRAQLNKLDTQGVKLPFEEDLRKMAPTINEWEAKSRYSESFIATIQDINTVFDLTEKLKEYCNGLVTETKTDS